jgi:erythromycin esterase-like protein
MSIKIRFKIPNHPADKFTRDPYEPPLTLHDIAKHITAQRRRVRTQQRLIQKLIDKRASPRTIEMAKFAYLTLVATLNKTELDYHKQNSDAKAVHREKMKKKKLAVMWAHNEHVDSDDSLT